MLEHLRQHFARQLAGRSEQSVQALVRAGLRRGWALGLRMRLTLCQFVDLCVLFGLGFEDDHAHGWVVRAAEHTGARTPDERVTLLMMYAVEHARTPRHAPVTGHSPEVPRDV